MIRGILDAPASACVESLYLELGLIPIHIIIKARRVNYLHYLASLKKDEMLYKVFLAQWKYPVRGDWVLEVQKNLVELDIGLSLDELQRKSSYSFKRLVKIKTKEYTLKYLLELSESHKKMDSLSYTDLKLQNYLKDEDIPVAEAKNLFRFRTRAAKFKENMKNSYPSITCPLCHIQPDTQVHSVQCTVVKTKVNVEGEYKDIFSENIPSSISKTLMKISKLREDFI